MRFRKKSGPKKIHDKYTCKSCKRKIAWYAIKEGCRGGLVAALDSPSERRRIDEEQRSARQEKFMAWCREQGLDDCPKCDELAKQFIRDNFPALENVYVDDEGAALLMKELGLTPWKEKE